MTELAICNYHLNMNKSITVHCVKGQPLQNKTSIYFFCVMFTEPVVLVRVMFLLTAVSLCIHDIYINFIYLPVFTCKYFKVLVIFVLHFLKKINV